jgi:hypothetical protein
MSDLFLVDKHHDWGLHIATAKNFQKLFPISQAREKYNYKFESCYFSNRNRLQITTNKQF